MLPAIEALASATLIALRQLGGSGSVADILDAVAENLRLSQAQLNLPHTGDSSKTKLSYRLGWARTQLKNEGLIENPRRAYWQLSAAGWDVELDEAHAPNPVQLASANAPKRSKEESSMLKSQLPPFRTLVAPALEALRELGGRARKAEISKLVAEKAQLSDEQLKLAYPSRGLVFTNTMNDVRTYMLKAELITQPSVGLWQLTEKGWQTEQLDASELSGSRTPSKRRASSQNARGSQQAAPQAPAEIMQLDDLIASHSDWQADLLDRLQQFAPDKFERFMLRILQASKLQDIEVLRNDSDVCEGMASVGGGLMSQGHVRFRCVRGSAQLVTSDVSDYRREVDLSRALWGLLITTSEFTQEARREAERHQRTRIDLIDGQQLVSKLKELEIGVKSEVVRVERVTIDQDWLREL